MNYEDLSPEQQAQAANCKTLEEALAFAKKMDHTLSDEELDQISGGGWGGSGDVKKCPDCGSDAIEKDPAGWQCLDCGKCWN